MAAKLSRPKKELVGRGLIISSWRGDVFIGNHGCEHSSKSERESVRER